jgi:hypothetical protein
LPSIDEDVIFREGYYGGRVAPQQAFFETKGYVAALTSYKATGKVDKVLADAIRNSGDTLVLGDVVSLYPSVMKGYYYPSGSYKWDTYTEEESEAVCVKLDRGGEYMNQPEFKASIMICYWQVDLQSPDDLITPYLFTRNAGKLECTLSDKTEQWVYGPDLWEAIMLGYIVIKIYKRCIWEKRTKLFDEYIDRAFAGKAKAGKENNKPAYQIYKLLMNALSGKHAQKIIKDTFMLYLHGDSDQYINEGASNLAPIINNKSKVIGIAATVPKDGAHASHAAYLSGFILAHSRRKMSKLLRSTKTQRHPLGGYHSTDLASLYQDTDSYLFTKKTWDKIPTAQLGDELGLFKDEYPDDVIIKYVCLTKKTYCLALLTKENDIKLKIRCKGVPHRGDIFKYETPRVNREVLQGIQADIDNGTQNEHIDLSYRAYEVKTRHGLMVAKHITAEMFQEVLVCGSKITAYFGTLKRSMLNVDPTFLGVMSIVPRWCHRSLTNTDYWNGDNRVKTDKDKIAVPYGWKQNEVEEAEEMGIEVI